MPFSSRVLVAVALALLSPTSGVAAADSARWADRAPGTVVPLVGTGNRETPDQRLGGPRGLAAAPDGTIYYTEHHQVVAVAPDGTRSTVDTRLDAPTAVAVDRDGALYIADTDQVRKVDTSGTVTTVARLAATGLATGADGALFVVDAEEGGRILRVDASGAVATVVGGGDSGLAGSPLPADVSFGGEPPVGLAVDDGGDLYFSTGREVFRLDPAGGPVRSVAGGDPPNSVEAHGLAVRDDLLLMAGPLDDVVRGLRPDGTRTEVADLDDPSMLATDAAGNVYVATDRMTRIRRIDPDGTITTVAEPGPAIVGADATEVAVDSPWPLAVDREGTVFVGGFGTVLAVGADGRVRSEVDTGLAVDLAAGPDGSLYVLNGGRVHRAEPGDGTMTPVAGSSEVRPTALATSPAGELYMVSGTRVDRVDRDGTSRPVVDLDGVDGFTIDEARERDGARLAVAVAGNGEVYVAAATSNRVFAVNTDGEVRTVAGDGTDGAPEDGGDATASPVDGPRALAVATDGTLYIATNYGVRRVSADGGIDTVAAIDAGSGPVALALDAHGNLYVALKDRNQVVAVVRPGEVAAPFSWRVAWWGLVIVVVAVVAIGAPLYRRRRAARAAADGSAHVPPPGRDYWT